MKQKKLLTLTFSQLKQIFNQELPELVEIAEKSTTVEDFKAELLTFSETCDIKSDTAKEAREQIRLLLHYDGQHVHELSTGQDMSVDYSTALQVSDGNAGKYGNADGFVY